MLARFHPIVRQWFTETLGKPSDPQRKGWPAIASGAHTLILAPTGTGKTLAAFLWELNAADRRAESKEPLGNAVHLLYISPLKALNNDIQRNLDRPLAELRETIRGCREGISRDSGRCADGRHSSVGAGEDAAGSRRTF